MGKPKSRPPAVHSQAVRLREEEEASLKKLGKALNQKAEEEALGTERGGASGAAAPLRGFSRMTERPKMLDLFCCAGGAAVGYHRAGFDVTGVDVEPQPNYPFPFLRMDALNLSAALIGRFDAIHASPPCQHYSDLAKRNGNAADWPDLVANTRAMLEATGKPWVIENVEGAPLFSPVVLCGTMFPGLRIIRHRLFEANFPLAQPRHISQAEHPLVHTLDKRKNHYGKTCEWSDFVQVTGGGNCSIASARDAMGIDWMTKKEINEAIPPAYAEYVGRELMRHLRRKARGKIQLEREDTPLLAGARG